jgi:hypothetical protein
MIMEKFGYLIGIAVHRISRIIGSVWTIVIFCLKAIAVLSAIAAAVLFVCSLNPIPLFWLAMMGWAYEMGQSK